MSGQVSAPARKGKKSSRKEHKKKQARLSEAQTVLGWSVILALAALLGAIYLYQTSEIATVGRDVQFDQLDLNTIKQENAELERDITEAQSLERVREEAIKMGFVPADPDDVEYVIVDDYPTGESVEVEPDPLPTEHAAESMGEALWLYFEAGLSDLIRGESS